MLVAHSSTLSRFPTTDHVGVFKKKCSLASASFLQKITPRVSNLVVYANGEVRDETSAPDRNLNLPNIAREVKKKSAELLNSALIASNYLVETITQIWHSFLQARQESTLRQKVRQLITLSPKGCLISAGAGCAVTALAIAALSENYKKRWLGYAGLLLSTATVIYLI